MGRGEECPESAELWEYAAALKEFSCRAEALTTRWEERMNILFSGDALLCTSYLYADRRYQVDCGIGKFSEKARQAKEEEIKKTLSSYLGVSGKYASRTQMMDTIRERSAPVERFLEEYRRELKHLYLRFCNVLWHVSPTGNIRLLRASQSKVNMYYTEQCDGIYAASDYYEILLYAARAAAGAMYVLGGGGFCIYEGNPFGAREENWVYLRKRVSLYRMEAEFFEPVIDFVPGKERTYLLKFGHEWIARQEELPCREEAMERLPAADLGRYEFYWGEKRGEMMRIVDQSQKCRGTEELFRYLEELVSQKRLGKIRMERE